MFGWYLYYLLDILSSWPVEVITLVTLIPFLIPFISTGSAQNLMSTKQQSHVGFMVESDYSSDAHTQQLY